MAIVVFGNYRVDMADPDFLDPIIGNLFDGRPSASPPAPPYTELVATFPSGATVVFHGNFVFGLNSPVTGVDIDFPGGATVMSLTGLVGLTIGGLNQLNADQMLDALFGRVTEVYTQGFDDVLIGDATNEIAHAGGGNDIIEGNGGNDVLDGQAGADQMSGGPGNDIFYVDNTGDVVTELLNQGLDLVRAAISFTLPQHVENLILETGAVNGAGNALDNAIQGNDSANALDGGDGNDKLEGLGGNDALLGGAGNDTLDGGGGVDSMTGGLGDDQYGVDAASDAVAESVAGGVDTVRSTVSRILEANVEHLVLLGGAASGTGNDGANTLTGSDGANILDGRRGADTMAGGKGSDNYSVDFSLDQVIEFAGVGTGTDHVVSKVSQTLAPNVEYLTLAPSAGNIDGTGNAGANVIEGNDGANVLDGGAGDDSLRAHGGDDTLLGGLGNDTLAGALGRDLLSGGAGNDHFVFDTAIASGTNLDQIVDFVSGQDEIHLQVSIFSAIGAPGAVLLAADFVSGAGAVALDASDRVIHDTAIGMVYYDADGSGAQQMLPFAQVASGQALAATDFHVVG